MMELTGALLFIFIALATSTPHGYGVKSGALAKAESGALSGTYGAAPLTRSGAGGASYSGAFSNSASSSFAASSASSSSFSYSGSGGFNSASGGCGTGNCPNNNGAITPTGPGTGDSTVNGANAGAIAGSQSGSLVFNQDGSPCTGNCGTSENKCTSGNCGIKSQLSSSPSKYDSNDIPVLHTQNPKYNQNANNFNPNTPPLSNPSSPGCTTGNCGQSPKAKPVNQGVYSNIPSQPSANCDSPNCNNLNNGPYSTLPQGLPNYNYNKPSTLLSTPKESGPVSTKCTLPNCNTNTDLYSSNLPSSYNVPIHGSYPSKPQPIEPGCTTPNCNNGASAPTFNTGTSISTYYSTPNFNSEVNNGQKCSEPGCDSSSPNNNVPHVTTTKAPNFIALSHPKTPCSSGNCAGGVPHTSLPSSRYPSQTNTPQNNGCGSSGCNQPRQLQCSGSHCEKSLSSHGVGQPPSSQGFYGHSNPVNIPNANQKDVTYNGGFDGSSGLLNPNDYSLPSKLPQSSSSPTFKAPVNNGGIQHTYPSSQFNQGSSASIASANAAASANSVVYSGGFGGPPGILKPYDGGKVGNQIQINSNSKYQNPAPGNPNVNPSANSPTHGGLYGNINGAEAGALAGSAAGSYSGSFGSTGSHGHGHNGKTGTGCNSGCGANSDSTNEAGLDIRNFSSGLGGSAAGAYSAAGSFASSSATAAAGAGVKGGYGGK